MLACLAGAARAEDRTFAGFRLLELDHRPVRWQPASPGTPISIGYAFVTRSMVFPGAVNCGRMNSPRAAIGPSKIDEEAFRREVGAAFRMWESVADISFHEVSDPETAHILIGAQGDPMGRAFTNVFWRAAPDQKIGTIDRALICINPTVHWKIGFDGDLSVYDVRYTIGHEIGHAIGLDHPGPEGQLMSFRYEESHAYLRAGDMAGAAFLYGARGPVSVVNDGEGAAAGSVAGLPVRPLQSTPGLGIGELKKLEAPQQP